MKIHSCYYILTLQIEKELGLNLIEDEHKFIAVVHELVTKPDYFWLPKGNQFYRNRLLLNYICETRGQKN